MIYCTRSIYPFLCRFNRYMVECEFDKIIGCFFKEESVLIDTWWNVNLFWLLLKFRIHLVLIDTWWNVNFNPAKVAKYIGWGFNRYMVECE